MKLGLLHRDIGYLTKPEFEIMDNGQLTMKDEKAVLFLKFIYCMDFVEAKSTALKADIICLKYK